MVGCVIVVNKTIVAEAYTSPYGGNHAEVNAIQAVKDKSLLKKATLYVTLEPCSHFGKTPPCSDLIIKHKIPNVVIGCVDDNPKVAGRGIKKLQAAGCNVVVGILEQLCREHHKRFFTFHTKKRPYIILKWAQTWDGFIAPKHKDQKKPVWISNFYSRQIVHKWRTEEQAILVGTNTVIEDNPVLTSRDWVGLNPTRIVIDKKCRLDLNYNIFNSDAQTIVISEESIDFEKPLAAEICDFLYLNNIISVIIEGGAQTLQTFINENIWDEARVFTGEVKFNTGLKAPELKGRLVAHKFIKNDHLKIFAND
jgi:diaminohydroxyphosphoribosylaminopyrimidine deaminase/5-amino-6-(5-phosphoribosylamino)uracil reductase